MDLNKILYLSDVSLNIVGGAQESMKIIIDGLKDIHQFYIITPRSNKIYKRQVILSKYDSFTLKGKSIREIICLIRDIKVAIKRINPSIIHVQMPATMLIIGFLKYFKMLPKGIKIYYTDRGVFNKYGYLTRKLIPLFSSNFTYIITTTNYNKSLYLKNRICKDTRKLLVIPNTAGVLFDVYHKEKRLEERNKYKITEEEIVVGFSGRISIDKDWPLAIKIIKELNKYYNFKVLLALGTDKSAKQIEEAKAIISKIKNIIGYDRLISFIDLPIESMNNIYYINDIFILTSKQESFGRTAIEAMARKNVVFGTRVDGLEEVINFEENKYSSIDEFLEKIEGIFKSKTKLNFEKEKFYEHYHKNYETNICIHSHNNIY